MSSHNDPDNRVNQESDMSTGVDINDPEVIRGDLERGTRFLHAMAMETKLGLERVDGVLRAAIDSLVARGVLDAMELASRVQDLTGKLREASLQQTHVEVEASVDKYAATDLPDIDCSSLMELCHGRCCKLHFPLSFQDLDERVVQWRYEQPYRIRQRASDGYCVHSDPHGHYCTVYAHRPLTCRKYDCRRDTRVWIDFEHRIPAPMAEVETRPVMLYQIALKKP